MVINMTEHKLKKALPYAGIPALIITLVIFHRELQSFILLQSVLITIFGYIATVSDIKTRRVPNALVLTMLTVWVVTMAPYLFWDTNAAIILLKDAVIGFISAGLLFMLIYLISRKGVGGGDVKFMAAAGLYIGFANIVGAMFYGSVFAGLTALVLLMLKKIRRKDTMPLIPFLYIGILMTVFYR